MKSIPITFRVNPNEFEWLTRMASGCGYRNYSDWLRRQIWHEAEKRGWLDKKAYPVKMTQSEWRLGRPKKHST